MVVVDLWSWYLDLPDARALLQFGFVVLSSLNQGWIRKLRKGDNESRVDRLWYPGRGTWTCLLPRSGRDHVTVGLAIFA